MDPTVIAIAVREVVLEVVQEKHPERTSVEDRDRLNGDLGLRSLDLAQIVALLEMKLDADPFAELVPVTSIRTVGDIIKAYALFFSGAKPSEAATDEGADRANRRLEATRQRRGE